MHRTVSAEFTPEPLCAAFTLAQTERLQCKSTKLIGIIERNLEKFKKYLQNIWNQLKDFHTSLRQAKRQSRAAASKKKQIQPNKYLFIFGQVVENVYLCNT